MEDRRNSKTQKTQKHLAIGLSDFDTLILSPLRGDNERLAKSQHNKLRKKIYSQTNKISKNLLDLSVNIVIDNISTDKWIKNKKKLFHSLKELTNLTSLPKLLLQIPFFANYQTCSLFVHEKGNNNSSVFSYNIQDQPRSFKIPVNEFNQIFTSVKKSKNKTFNAKNLEAIETPNLNEHIGPFHGTFLAEEIALSNSNIVIMASRNDFLPPLREEMALFNKFVNLLPGHIKILIDNESTSKKIRQKIACLQEFPLPLAIENTNGTIIFENNSYLALESLSNSSPQSCEKIHFPNGFTLNKLINYAKNSASDLFHFQRISLLGELLNTLKHELSNPLFGLKLTTELLINEDSDDTNENYMFLNEISNNVSRCQNIIDNFSKIYNNSQSLIRTSLRQNISEALTLAKSEIRDIAKTISYSHFTEDDPIFATGNPTWIIQILFNLLINSSQAIKSKNTTQKPHIHITIKPETVNLIDFITITLSDNGPGITCDDSKKLFDPFFTTKQKGTGLGLAICKNLVEKMHGKISYIKLDSCGATFKISLPACHEGCK